MNAICQIVQTVGKFETKTKNYNKILTWDFFFIQDSKSRTDHDDHNIKSNSAIDCPYLGSTSLLPLSNNNGSDSGRCQSISLNDNYRDSSDVR